jgi:hypothetical protein
MVGLGVPVGAHALARTMMPERAREIDLNVETLESARDRMFAIWGGSLSGLSYVEHGGLDRLATEGLLTSADVPALVQMHSTPVVFGWSCNIARFVHSGVFLAGRSKPPAAPLFRCTGCTCSSVILRSSPDW